MSGKLPTPDYQQTLSYRPITFVENLLVNGADLRVPVAELHPAQAYILQHIAELTRSTGGFRVFCAGRVVRACIRFSAIRDVHSACLHVLKLRNQLVGLVNKIGPSLTSGGGSCKDIDAQVRRTGAAGAYLEIGAVFQVLDHSDVQVTDILIAKLAAVIEQLTNGARSEASINDTAGCQLLCAQVTFDPASFSLEPMPGHALAGRMVELHNFTCMANERVCARNADILAAVNSMLGALGSASGSAGSGRSAWTAYDDHGVPLAIWYRDHQGHLAGRLSLPMLAQQADHIGAAAGVTSMQADVAATVQCTPLLNTAVAAIGLAQSLTNLHEHAAEAIARSDYGQHAYDLALLAGARDSEIVHVVKALISAQSIRWALAITALEKLRRL